MDALMDGDVSMSQERDNALTKVELARYFLELMKRIENSRAPLLQGSTALSVLQEYTSYLDGFWAECYSATRYFDDVNPKCAKALKDFREKTQGDFYAWGTGKRSISVHHKPVEPKREGYMPPRGDNIGGQLLEYDPPNWNKINSKLNDYYYFTDDPSEQPIIRQCEDHLAELEKFIKENCP